MDSDSKKPMGLIIFWVVVWALAVAGFVFVAHVVSQF
jgi:hypothetical protein